MSQKLSFADSSDDKTDNRSISGSLQNPKSEVNFITLKIEDSSVNRKGTSPLKLHHPTFLSPV